jgi:hypothetical protein
MKTISSAEHSADVAALVALFAVTKPGDIVTFQAMDAVLGRPVASCRWLALKALRVVNDESGYLFSSVMKTGYKRLDAEEAPKVGQTTRQRIRRAARRTSKTIVNSARRANNVSPEAQRRINAELSALGLIEHIARDAPTKKMEEDSGPLPLALAGKRFMQHIGVQDS